ncbi:MAG TPA: M12 family metallopeptidase [Bacteroidales bacterium]|nr:M12 family metallopeptidase [Bacteroidales bacterium]HOR81474.1 M12 family metallopeptidase [Bacteroidales bacterium]HPJ90649.1 M12 family metallopeptidase [Bacteroidales bacterium]
MERNYYYFKSEVKNSLNQTVLLTEKCLRGGKQKKRLNYSVCTIIVFVAITFALTFSACKKDFENSIIETKNQKSIIDDPIEHPYTYLQNKYMDLVLIYELEKRGEYYNPDSFSYEQKIEKIHFLDLIMQEETQEETQEDINFYQNIVIELIDEINAHPYIQNFVANFALLEFYDENDIIVYTGYSDCYDAISKFQILQYYENGFDIFGYYLQRNALTGNEEWGLPLIETEDPMQKAVRYTLHLKWNNTIPYMWNTSNQNIRTKTLWAMADWRVAANYKISFSEITTKINWNKTCWVMGWKYFIRIGYTNTNAYAGRSTIGRVPWALMDFTNDANYPRTYRHELGHSLGLYHEHQRPDRDNYITYYSNNVMSGAKSQFCKMAAGSYNYYGSSFDFNSIMLYSSYAFTKNGSPTWTKKDGTTIHIAPSSISATDKNVIRQIYY